MIHCYDVIILCCVSECAEGGVHSEQVSQSAAGGAVEWAECRAVLQTPRLPQTALGAEGQQRGRLPRPLIQSGPENQSGQQQQTAQAPRQHQAWV